MNNKEYSYGTNLNILMSTLNTLKDAINELSSPNEEYGIYKNILEDMPVRNPGYDEILKSYEEYDRGFKLDASMKDNLEYLFGADFSSVTIHTGKYAEYLTRKSDAHALTKGSDIYFSFGKYSPETEEGMKLLIHELQHVVQYQRGDRHLYKEDFEKAEEEADSTEDSMVQSLLYEVPDMSKKPPMPGEIHPTLFENTSDPKKAVQLEKSTTTSGGGLGSFSSKGGEGTCYVITLRDGTKVELTSGEKETLFNLFESRVCELMSESKLFSTEDEYEKLLINFIEEIG